MKLKNKKKIKKIKKLKTLQKTKKNYNFLEISLAKIKKTLFKQRGTKILSGIFCLKKSKRQMKNKKVKKINKNLKCRLKGLK